MIQYSSDYVLQKGENNAFYIFGLYRLLFTGSFDHILSLFKKAQKDAKFLSVDR